MSEKEALRVVQDVASGDRHIGSNEETILIREDLEALATMCLANRIHMQQLKGELEALREEYGTLRQIMELHDGQIAGGAKIAGEALARVKVLEDRMAG